MRERVYPRWIENGKMTKENAELEIDKMRAVLETLQTLCPNDNDNEEDDPRQPKLL